MEINGLPMHPLVVHFSVVLVMLAALLGVLFVIPRTRRWALWPLPLVSIAAAVATFLAKQSGEDLEERVESGAGESAWRASGLSQVVHDHAELADLMFVLVLIFAAIAVVAWFVARRPAGLSGAPQMVLSVLLIAAAIGVSVQMYRVGDAGAKAVWNHSVQLGAGESGGDGD